MVIPPHRRAKDRLRAATELISEPYRFCSLVSDVLRIYLEERFELHAPDRTTEEFLAELGGRSVLSESQKGTLAEFLSQCDLVKFARDEPTRTDLENLHQSAMRLVVETSPNGGADDGPSVAGKPVELLEPGKTSTNHR